MQIDRRYHTPKGAYDSQQHLEQVLHSDYFLLQKKYLIQNIKFSTFKATQILIDTINCVARNHKSWTQLQQTKGGISGYNAGCGNVQVKNF